MTPKEKIKYVKDKINDAAKINPIGSFRIELLTLDEYEDGPTIISRAEQWSIVRKLEQEGYVKNVEPDENKFSAWMELVPKAKPGRKKTRHSNLLSHIKTTDELIQHRALFQKFLDIIEHIGNIKPKRTYRCETDERNDDLIQLLIDLNVVEYDWDKMKEQTHRQIGNRIIEFTFDGGKALALRHRVSGVGGIVRKEALELVSKEIGDRFTMNKIVEFFTGQDVPENMFVQDTKWRAIFYVLSFYATSKSHREHLKLLKLIEAVLHPLMFDGDEEKTKKARDKYTKWLKYDRIVVDDRGRAYLGASPEDEEVGVDDWITSDGEVVEPKAYAIYPSPIAALSVLWSQLVVVVSAYYNPALDHRELEKLYLEIIGKAEELIEGGKVGNLKERYERPFASLATAEIEARAKKVENPLALITSFLLEINALKPEPSEIAKKIEENAELIGRIIAATRIILSDDKLENLLLISHEQAIFVLKLVFGNLFKILDTTASGPINVADEELNAKYILLWDAFQKLLERKDFEELKKNVPQLPEHLFEDWGDMDVWWDEGGKSSLMRFYGDVEKLWVRSGRQTFPVLGQLVELFNTVDKKVNEHGREKATLWNKMLKNIDDAKERGEIGFPSAEQRPSAKTPENFVIRVKDREIWISDFLLSKPYGAGTNMSFFEYIIQHSDQELQRESMPTHIKNEVGGKSFSKILNALGFKGEILKAFVPKRGKSSLLFRKETSKDQLEKEGVKIHLLLQELVLAHTRNSPK
ncbi:MAG: hypothetical protein WAZ27_04550 [Minisyncoccia bacterium]